MPGDRVATLCITIGESVYWWGMGQPPTETGCSVVERVADTLGTSIEELPTLSNTVDPDALDAVVTADPSSDVSVSFTYAGVRVLVYSRETVYVQTNEADTVRQRR
jgi:hypothetical protein